MSSSTTDSGNGTGGWSGVPPEPEPEPEPELKSEYDVSKMSVGQLDFVASYMDRMRNDIDAQMTIAKEQSRHHPQIAVDLKFQSAMKDAQERYRSASKDCYTIEAEMTRREERVFARLEAIEKGLEAIAKHIGISLTVTLKEENE